MVGQFVYSTYEVDADALAMPTTPLDEVLRLRGQCESQAKRQQLYSRRDASAFSRTRRTLARVS